MAYFGETDQLDATAMARHASEGQSRQQLQAASFLRPMTPYGQTYTPSYTSFLNSPANSYVHPLHTLFNDRRPRSPSPRTTLYPT